MATRTGKMSLNFGLDRFSGIYLFALFLAVFGFWAPTTFWTSSTLHSVASTQAVSGMVALALLVPMVCGQYDLSVGATANFSGIVAILVQLEWHWSVPLAIVFSVFIGLVIGAVNGAVVVILRVNSFIATLAMSSILAAVLIIITAGNQPNPVITSTWNNLTQEKVAGFQIIVLYLLIMATLLWWFLQYTPAGRYLYAIGGNSEAARLSGLRVNRWSWLSLIMSGGIAGLAGVFYTSLSGPALSFGATLLLPAFAAVFLGSTQIQASRMNVWGTLVAIYVLATGVEGLQFVSGQQWLQNMFDGVALIVAVALAGSRQRSASRAKRRPADEINPPGTSVVGTPETPTPDATLTPDPGPPLTT
jgi:ribose transport system permease protein